VYIQERQRGGRERSKKNKIDLESDMERYRDRVEREGGGKEQEGWREPTRVEERSRGED
jgi:hypothetical protein